MYTVDTLYRADGLKKPANTTINSSAYVYVDMITSALLIADMKKEL